jgi:phosphoglycolate phosphatase-like HAD superfamily hydrolase
MVRLVLFDIDGTLVNTGGAGEKAFARVCAEEFAVPHGTRELQFAGRTDPSIVREFFSRHGITPDPEHFRRFFDRYVFWLDHMLGCIAGRVLPGVPEWIRGLEELSVPPVIGLLTGNIRLGAEIKLKHYGLWERFELGGFGDDHEDRNVLAEVARDRGARRLGRALPGDAILVVGDTPRDVECARAIGARCLAVATGKFSVEELRREKPDWAVDTLEALAVEEVAGQPRAACCQEH